MIPDSDLFCPACTYNLRGITSERCPECGTAFDRTTLAVSHIPWVHRKEIGRIRAYWRTLWLATFHPKRIAQDMSAPVNYQDGRRFAWVTITLAVMLSVPVLFVPLTYIPSFHDPQWGFMWDVPSTPQDMLTILLALQDRLWGGVLNLIGVWLALLVSIRLAQFFFRPRRLSIVQQNRAAALSQYGSAPMAWLGLLFGLLMVAGLIHSKYQHYSRFDYLLDNLPQATLVISYTVVALAALLWMGNFCMLLWRITCCGPGRVLAFILGYPICLSIGLILAAGVIEICGVIAIVFASLFR